MKSISPGSFRFILANVVVISHFSMFGIGTAAVELFFVLSGYWVYRLFDTRYMRAHSPASVFISSRFLRIAPMFLLFNLMAILVHRELYDIGPGADWFSKLPNYVIIGYAGMSEMPLSPAWSLDIEMQFYILFPVVYILMAGIGRALEIVMCLFLAFGITYFCYFGVSHSPHLFPYIGFFLIGLMAAKLRWQPSLQASYALAIVALAALGLLTALPELRGLVIGPLDKMRFFWNPAVNFCLAVLLAPLALTSVCRKSSKLDRLLGDWSYVLYCCHWLGALVAYRYLADLDWLIKVPITAGLIVMSYAVSLGVLLYVDRPISRWRERWVERQLRPIYSAPASPKIGESHSAGAVGPIPDAPVI